ncbi:hypothetical protein GCM10023318_05830 [Nocardia callitridis]|uniref:M23ase beta-sheet core domain-containing protein n=1 Tax=Nocardia callitridis TaxID=648753 RepID=A0ABP9JVG0_9NOCA
MSGPVRHRADASAAERVRAAAGAAVAAGAIIGVVAQVGPALAAATPLYPTPQDNSVNEVAEPVADQSEAVGVPEALAASAAQAAPSAQAPAPVKQAAEVAAPVAAPFGIPNLPPEISGPLGQAEDALQDLQRQVAPPTAVRPVAGPISSGFGSRWGTAHNGIDFADQLGTPIHSVSNGTVIEAGPASGFGLWVRVAQEDGTTAVYGHVNEMFVSAGQQVRAGEVIATVGNRGQSTGPHLHLEIWDQGGTKVDPMPYLLAKGVPLEWGPTGH